VSRELLLRVMRRWATGVTVVTLRAGDQLRGMTVNSFTSVSLDPPQVLVCIDKRARCHDLALGAGRYCVNILSAEQEPLSERYAGRRPAEHADFADSSGRTTALGAPVLDGALAYLDCRVVAAVDGGDHTVLIASVDAAEVLADGQPLLFLDGRYGRFSPHQIGSPTVSPVTPELAFAVASL
jgi:flavin reductase (DIM6/NTAB) family NADH-FMN oxidoreductase RutF